MSLKYHYLLLFLFVSSFCTAQNEENIWYFGKGAGLDFNYTPPHELLDSRMSTNEGCATIADEDGNLLFYTDGLRIWNKKHNLMENGSDLKGHSSSTQSGVIVPKPNSNTLFYVFTVSDKSELEGLYYNVVDMEANGGLGKVIEKNVLLLTRTCEKVAAVPHANKKDAWIITRKFQTDEYHAFLLRNDKIFTNPVVSHTGHVVGGSDTSPREVIGYLKASADSTKLAAVNYADNSLELMGFDNETGKLTKTDIIMFEGMFVYGVEFSPNSRFLYVTAEDEYSSNANCYVYQFDLLAGSVEDIKNSKIAISTQKGKAGENGIGSIQLAPNKKMYITWHKSNELDIIHLPDNGGDDCSYELDGLYLQNSLGWGLPTFAKTFYVPRIQFSADSVCLGRQTSFTVEGDEYSTYLWDFGEPSAGGDNFSSEKEPTHTYMQAGEYTVTLYADYYGWIDTLVKKVRIVDVPEIDLDDEIYADFSSGMYQNITISNPSLFDHFLWSTGKMTSSIWVYEYGQYTVKAYKDNCVMYDTIMVYDENFSVSEESFFCEGDSVLIDVSDIATQAKWTVGTDALSFYVHDERLITGELTDETGMMFQYMHRVKQNTIEYSDFVSDIVLCEGDIFRGTDLQFDKNIDSVIWSTGQRGHDLAIAEPGEYSVTVNLHNGCVRTDTFVVASLQKPAASIMSPDTICETRTIEAVSDCHKCSFLWNTGSLDRSTFVEEDGLYSLIVTDANGCDTVVEKQITIQNQFNGYDFPDDTLVCLSEGEAFVVELYNKDYNFQWNNGAEGDKILIDKSGDYAVTVSSDDGCEIDGYFHVDLQSKPNALLEAETVICSSDLAVDVAIKGDNVVWYSDFDKKNVLADGSELQFDSLPAGRHVYYVSQNIDGCESRASKQVIVVLDRSASRLLIEGDSTICVYDKYTHFSATEGFKLYTWMTSGSEVEALNSYRSTYEVDFTQTGLDTVWVEAVDSNGCVFRGMQKVAVAGKPEAYFSALQSENQNSLLIQNLSEKTVFDATGQSLENTYRWNFRKTEPDVYTTVLDTTVFYQPGDYRIYLTAENEYGCIDEFSLQVYVENSFFHRLLVPNAFCPTHPAEKVSHFTPVGCGLDSYEIKIYDVWGNLVWHSDKLESGQPAEAWDGTYKGVVLKPDTYTWHIDAIFKDGTVWEGIETEKGVYSRFGPVILVR